MARTQITLDAEIQRRAHKRADELGVSFAEYVRRLLVRDLAEPRKTADVSALFDLGSSGGSDITRNKDEMIGDAMDSLRKRSR